jgi:salicylate hydroxylase
MFDVPDGRPAQAVAMSEPLHVIVIGGGIGGLTLAHGLRRAGVSVAVYERDRTLDARQQGYRIHINRTGNRALRACLPPSLHDAFVATSGEPQAGVTFCTEKLRELLFIPRTATELALDPAERGRSASRITLRQILMTGLDDVVHVDKRYVSYDVLDGRVTAHFADGTSATGDVLVGADGAGSSVRRQYLPQADRVDTGIAAIVAKVWLTDEIRATLPDRLHDGPLLVRAPRGIYVFMVAQEFDRDRMAVTAAPDGGGREPHAEGPRLGPLTEQVASYLMWGYSEQRERLDVPDLEVLAGRELQDLVLRRTAGWHPKFSHLFAAADTESVATLSILTSVPVDPWEPTRVTLLGDAIHSMTPYRGNGGNTALRDAQLLCAKLTAAARGETPLLEAIGEYEAQMREYGFAAVRTSLTATRQVHLANPVGYAINKAVFRTMNALPWLRRRISERHARTAGEA